MRLFWGSLRRLCEILAVCARHGLAHWVGGRAAGWPWLGRWLPMAGRPAPERLRRLFEDLGGTFVKFGQMLALQPDILALEYCNALFKLLDRVEPFSWDDVERILREELGRAPEEIFDSIEHEPLATASVGQVHVAWYRGEKVAVKVQRPSVEIEFWSDIRLMSATMALIRGLRLQPLYWMLDPMSEFVGWTREELDYRNEARYSEELRSHALDPLAQHVPKVLRELTTRRTLVVELLDGITLLNYLRARDEGDEVLLRRLSALDFEPTRFAANVIDNFLGNAFRFGIYHADLHPANLMILRGSVVGYIDFGITGVLSEYARRRLMKMTLALAQGDMRGLYEEFLELTTYGPESDVRGFRAGLERLAEGWYAQGADGKHLAASFTRIMTEMLHLSRATNVMPERDIVKYIRSSIAIDGLITRFEPSFSLGAYLVETCSRFVKMYTRSLRFSVDRWLDFASASGSLLHDGPVRGARALDRLGSNELPVEIDPRGSASEQEALRARSIQLAGVAFATVVLMSLGPRPTGSGFDLWTAELIFVGVALVLLAGNLRRLRWS